MEIGGLTTATPTDDITWTADELLHYRGYTQAEIDARNAREDARVRRSPDIIEWFDE